MAHYKSIPDGVRTHPGKVWKVLEFNIEIFKALKSLEMIIGMEKSGGKILENCNADLENADVCNIVDYPCIC